MDQLFVYIARWKSFCADCMDAIRPGAFHVGLYADARCLACAGLADRMFVEPGDVALTRRATRESRTPAIVLRANRRGNFARVGILVERDALHRAKRSCMLDAGEREANREKSRERRDELDATYVSQFAAFIRHEFPAIPQGVDRAIAERACERGSRRVGRTETAKSFDRNAVVLAVRAHVRHRETPYETLLAGGAEVWQARQAIEPRMDEILSRWRG